MKELFYSVLNVLLYSFIWAAMWQLDLICAPLIWPDHVGDIFYLPCNIPIELSLAYCLFFSMIMIPTFILTVMDLTLSVKVIYKETKRWYKREGNYFC